MNSTTRLFKPNYAQEQAILALSKFKGNKGVIVLPTGTGKTILSAIISKKFKRVLFVAHRNEIIEQASQAYQKYYEGELKVSFFNQWKKELGKHTFATVQTLTKNIRKIPKDYFDLVVIDEAHHYQADSFKKVVKHFEPKFLLGITATPLRHDNKDIFELCGECIYELPIREAIERNILCGINYYCVDNDIDFSKIEWTGENYKIEDLNKKICIDEYDKKIFEEYKKNCSGKKTIAFSATIQHASRLSEFFKKRKVRAVSLSTNTKRSERKKIFDDFKSGKYDIIFVRDLFNEGVDIPNADVLFFLRPTESRTVFTQQLGRGLRTFKGKKELLVLDFTGNAKHSEIGLGGLSSIVGQNISNAASGLHSSAKELILVNYGIKIRLSKKKIDFVKQLSGNTKQSIGREYFELKKRLGRIPMSKEFSVSDTVIANLFGNYSSMVNEMENANLWELRRQETKELLLQKWKEFTLTKDFKVDKKKFLSFIGKKHWSGSWSIKFNGLVQTTGHRSMTASISKKEITDRYNTFKQKINRVPGIVEMRRKAHISDITIRKKFGSWKDFLIEMGDFEEVRYSRKNINHKLSKHCLKWNKEELEKIYIETKAKLGRTPTMDDLNRDYHVTNKPFKSFYGGWNEFLLSKGDRPTMPSSNTSSRIFETDKEMIKKQFYDLKEKIGRTPSTYDFEKIGEKQIQHRIKQSYGSYDKFLKMIGEKKSFNWSNITVFPDYPKEKPYIETFPPNPNRKPFDFPETSGKNHDFGEKKDAIRQKILSHAKNGDTILLLESPECFAIKKLMEMKIKPKKVIIPNNQEYKQLIIGLLGLRLPFRVEVHKTSSTQYLKLTKEKFDFIWLDYFGSFTQYRKDVDLLYSNNILSPTTKIFGTYRILDLQKKNETHYFSEALNYYLQKSYEKNRSLSILPDVSLRYKTTMYNVGIELTKGAGV